MDLSGFKPVYLVVGEDASLLSHATSAVVDRLCGDQRGLVLVEASPEADLPGLLYGVNLFAPYQVVLLRKPAEHQVPQVVEYLSSPEPSTFLVVALPKAPKELSAAVRAAGGESVESSPRKAADAVRGLVDGSSLELDGRAKMLLTQHVGEDPSKVPSILSVVESVYGPGARIGVDQLEPFLGEAGGVPPWDLTDALDRHDAVAALRVLSRMLRGRAPLAVFASITNHFERLFRLSEAGIVSEQEAAAFLGLKGSTYPAKKALASIRSYRDLPGNMELVAAAAGDLKGGSGWPPELVLEVLVSRLASRP